MKKLIPFWVIIACLLILWPKPELYSMSFWQPSPAEVYKHAVHSIVLIGCISKDGNIHGGSGVVVAPNIVVTCAHVLEDALWLRVSKGGQAWNVQMSSTFVATPPLDLAFIYIPNLGLPVLPMETKRVDVGDTCYTLGCPSDIVDYFGMGVFNGARQVPFAPLFFVYSTAQISPGNSGGALLSVNGRLLGITAASMMNAQGINIAVHLAYVKALLPDAQKYFTSLNK
jgi:S1-C subfamily serine protease